MVNAVTLSEMKTLYTKRKVPIQVIDGLNAFILKLTDQGFTWICNVFKDNDERFDAVIMNDFLLVKEAVRMGEPLFVQEETSASQYRRACVGLLFGCSIAFGFFAIHRVKR